MKFLVVILFLCVSVFGQIEALSLKELAAQILSSGKADEVTRQEAAWILSRDVALSMTLAHAASENRDWRIRRSALSIWNCHGPDVVFAEAVTKRSFHSDHNWLVRRTTFESLIGMQAQLSNSILVVGLQDKNWSVRAACLGLLVTLPGPLDPKIAAHVVELTQDADQSVRDLAWRILIASAPRSPEAAQRLLSLEWDQLETLSLKREVIWSILDARSQGFLATTIGLETSSSWTSWRRAQSIILSEPCLPRVMSLIDLTRDKECRTALGDQLLQGLQRLIAQDSEWVAPFVAIHVVDPLRAELLSLILNENSTLAGRTGLLAAFCGMEKLDDVLLKGAFGLKSEKLPSILEKWFQQKAERGASRRELRRILKFRHQLKPPISDLFLLNNLERGGFAKRVIVAEQIWRRSNDELQHSLIQFLPRLEGDQKTHRSVIRILCESPRTMAKGVYRSVLLSNQYSRNDRLVAFTALGRISANIDHEILVALVNGDAPADLKDRAIRHLIQTKDADAQEKVVAQLLSTSGREFDLLTLNHALSCDSSPLVDYIETELVAGNFSSSTLVPMISLIEAKKGSPAVSEILRKLFATLVSKDAERRRHTGFERIDGSVLEHILGNFSIDIAFSDVFRLMTSPAIENKDRLLIGIAEFATRAEQARLLIKEMAILWAELADGAEDLERRSFLARPFVLFGGDTGRSSVLTWLQENLDDLLSEDAKGEDGWYGIVALDEILSSLIEEGSAESIKGVLELLVTIESRKSRRILTEALKVSPNTASPDSDITLFLAGTMSSLGRSERAHAMLRSAWLQLDKAADEVPAIPLRFWQEWSRQSVRFPASSQPVEFLAQRLLDLGLGNLKDASLLMNLGRRAMNLQATAKIAQIYRLGRIRSAAARRKHVDKTKRSEVWRYRSWEPNVLFWIDRRADFALDPESSTRAFSWPHRHHDEEMAKLILQIHAQRGHQKAWQAFDLSSVRSNASGIWLTTRIRMLLDEGQFEAAEVAAKEGTLRVFIFGSSSRLGNRRVFLSYQAAALWGQGKKAEAKRILKLARISKLAHLEGPTRRDFPGF